MEDYPSSTRSHVHSSAPVFENIPVPIIIFFTIILAVGLAYFNSSIEAEWVIGLVICLILFLVTLFRIEFGIVVLIFSMLLSPEIIVGEAETREITFRIEDILFFVIGFAWLCRNIIFQSGPLLKSTPLNLPIFLYTLMMLVSLIIGGFTGSIPIFSSTFYLMKSIEFFLVYFLVVNNLSNERQIKFFIGVALVTALIISLYGIFNIGETTRLTAPFEGGRGEPNTLGGYLTICIALTIALLLYYPDIHLKMILGLLFVLEFITLLFTLSRASFLGFIFMIGTLTILSKKKSLMAVLIIFCLAAPILIPNAVWERINITFEDPYGTTITIPGTDGLSVTIDSSSAERIMIWQKVGYLFIRSPLWGYGPNAHFILDSQFARVIVETGLIGLGLFFWLLWRIWKVAYSLFKNAQEPIIKAMTLGYLASFIGILIHSMGTITFYIVRIMEPFWFLTGMIVFCWIRNQEKIIVSKKAEDFMKESSES